MNARSLSNWLMLIGFLFYCSVFGYSQTGSLYNPFSAQKTGLPYWARMCGTGQPDRLTAKYVISTLDKVFASEGLDIVKDTFIERGQAKYTATTFNEEYQIGYIWIERNLGAGMVRVPNGHERWWGFPEKSFAEKKKDIIRSISFDYQRFVKDTARFFSSEKELKNKLFPAISKVKTARKKRAFFKKQLIDYKLQELLSRINKFDSEKNSIPKQWAFNPPNGTQHIDQLVIAGLYWKVAQYSFSTSMKIALEMEIQAIMKHRHRRRWLKHSQQLLNFLNHTNLNHLKSNRAYQMAFLKALNGSWRRRDLGEMNLISNYLTLDYFELGQIDKDNEDGAFFVAPISSLDERCILPVSFYFLPKPLINIGSLSVQEELAKMDKASLEEVEEIYTRLYGKDKQKTPKELQEEHRRQVETATLFVAEQLGEELRTYIRWAKAHKDTR